MTEPTPTQPAEPSTEAGRRLVPLLRQHWGEPYTNDTILAIEAEASRDAAARVEGPDAAESVTVLRDVLETIEKLYHPEIGWYVHPVYMRAARLVDGAALAAEPVPAAGLDVAGLREAAIATLRDYHLVAFDSGHDHPIEECHLPLFKERVALFAAAPQPVRETEAAGDAGHG